MESIHISAVIIGVFGHCSENTIPADNQAIQKAFFKLSKEYSEILKGLEFDEENFSQELENAIESFLCCGMFRIHGDKLETLSISEEIKQHFDTNISQLLSEYQINKIIEMGSSLPKLLRNNESVRYKRLTKA